jgi:hypothetical protein
MGDGSLGEVGFHTSGVRSKGNPFVMKNTNDFTVTAPKNEDFGIAAANPVGHTGSIKGECPDNCNFRGICDAGVCYCQMGFYGKTCNQKAAGSGKTVSLVKTLIVCGASLGVAFAFWSILLLVHQKHKKAREAKIGYDV